MERETRGRGRGGWTLEEGGVEEGDKRSEFSIVRLREFSIPFL